MSTTLKTDESLIKILQKASKLCPLPMTRKLIKKPIIEIKYPKLLEIKFIISIVPMIYHVKNLIYLVLLMSHNKSCRIVLEQ